MNPKDLRCYAIVGQLRRYEDFTLTGYEAVVTTADDEHVMVLTHDLTRTYELKVPWPEFVKKFTFRADATAEKQALQLRNTLRTIATKADKGVAVILERYLDQPPTLAEVTVKAPKKAATITGPLVRADYYRHTCLELSRTETTVTYIPLGDGTLDVHTAGIESFEEEFMHVMPDYPVEKAAQLYVQFGLHLGATPAAMKELGRFVNISKKEYDMATAKPVTEGATKTKPAPAVKNPPAAKKATTAAAKPAAKADDPAAKKTAPAAKPAAKTAPAKREPVERKPSAASRFQDLIMEGKLTDDEIFAAVKKEFSLSDEKRSYVSWYRNHLIKKGKNPPAAKEAKKAA